MQKLVAREKFLIYGSTMLLGRLPRQLNCPTVSARMAADMFSRLVDSGGPEQKTLVFCASDNHADQVAVALSNLYAKWCFENGQPRASNFAFKCTAKGGRRLLPELRGANSRAFVACTVDLISTGVDVPVLKNIVFFRYLKSPILFIRCSGGERGFTVRPENSFQRL